MAIDSNVVAMDPEKYQPFETMVKDHGIGVTNMIVDKAAERSYGMHSTARKSKY